MEVYLVGGAVRDKLLGYPVHERDWVVVGGTPEILTAQGYRPVGKDFPVFLHPQSNEEYALARTGENPAGAIRDFSSAQTPILLWKKTSAAGISPSMRWPRTTTVG